MVISADMTIEGWPAIKAIALALEAAGTGGTPAEPALAGVPILYGPEAPSDADGKRISLNPRIQPNLSYQEADVMLYLDVACTTPGRNAEPCYDLARAVQHVIAPTDMAKAVTPADTFKPLRNVMCTGLIPRDPLPAAGKTVRVLLVSFQIWAERA